MTGETIKTLAEYIAKLNRDNNREENLREYSHNPFDSNGVEEDYVETFRSPDIRSGASQ